MSKDFYKALAKRESSNIPNNRNDSHHGLYQMSPESMKDVKYMDEKGNWLGIEGINSWEDFYNNVEVQNKVVREYHELVYKRQNFAEDVGKVINGIRLTKTGIMAAAHLVGEGAAKKYIKSKGQSEIPKDELGTTFDKYAAEFAECTINLNYSDKASAQAHSHASDQPSQQKDTSTSKSQSKSSAPKESAPASAAQKASAAPPPSAAQASGGLYNVQPNDTLSSIAAKNGTTVEALLTNPGNEQFKANPDAIKPGDKINLSNSNASVQQPPAPSAQPVAAPQKPFAPEAQQPPPQSAQTSAQPEPSASQEAKADAAPPPAEPAPIAHSPAPSDTQPSAPVAKESSPAPATIQPDTKHPSVENVEDEEHDAPTPQPEAPAPEANKNIIKIVDKDTLSALAKANSMSLEQLLAIRGNEKYKDNPDLIHPGDEVNLGTQAETPAPDQPELMESVNDSGEKEGNAAADDTPQLTEEQAFGVPTSSALSDDDPDKKVEKAREESEESKQEDFEKNQEQLRELDEVEAPEIEPLSLETDPIEFEPNQGINVEAAIDNDIADVDIGSSTNIPGINADAGLADFSSSGGINVDAVPIAGASSAPIASIGSIGGGED